MHIVWYEESIYHKPCLLDSTWNVLPPGLIANLLRLGSWMFMVYSGKYAADMENSPLGLSSGIHIVLRILIQIYPNVGFIWNNLRFRRRLLTGNHILTLQKHVHRYHPQLVLILKHVEDGEQIMTAPIRFTAPLRRSTWQILPDPRMLFGTC